MLFNFQLCDIDGSSIGEQSFLQHWFGLTDGWYWIKAGDDELFRFSESMLKHREEDLTALILPYPNYQVARLWEDVIEIFPAVLTSLPDELVSRAASNQNWQMWISRAEEWVLQDECDEAHDLFSQATDWWNERRLYTSYLNHSPRIWLWRYGDVIHVQWNNQGLMRQGISFWSSPQGEFVLPVEAFIQEVIAFDERLMTEMSDRIATIYRHWARHDKFADLKALREEHKNRSTWLKQSLSNLNDHPATWNNVLRAIEKIESQVTFR